MVMSNRYDWIAWSLLVVGGLNWICLGLFNVDVISTFFGTYTTATRIIYSVVGLSAVYALFSACQAHSSTTTGRATT